MKSIEIIHKHKKTIIEAENGLVVLHLNHINLNNRIDSWIYSSLIEYESKNRKIWNNFTPIYEGDKFSIKLGDAKEIDRPLIENHDNHIKQPKSKLQQFYELESYLKEKGLL
ncbi:MAG: hypothetical protein IJZ01_01210 [Paraprevotella sp.]|nr:hypothetical protein [Paraprevotella sp.]